MIGRKLQSEKRTMEEKEKRMKKRKK